MLLFTGVSLNAQDVATEQMDERFNDGTDMPYGWFGEGWKVDKGVAKAEAIKEKENNGFPGMGGGTGTGTGTMPGGGMGGFNMFGGDHIRTYLLTPPVAVQNGEDLVFSARKPKKEGGFSFDLKAIMGFADTTFVVDRSVYGRDDQWVRVGEYTTTLTDEFQEFTISGTPEGKYRFRFVSYVEAELDSVAGFHIDNEAPDLLVTVDSLHTAFVDYSVCAEDNTKEFIVINTGTGTLDVNVTSDAPDLFSVDKSSLSIAVGDSATVNVKFHYAAGQRNHREEHLW